MAKRNDTRGRTGRPSLLTPAVHTAIVEAVTAGVPRATAAQRVGIARRTLAHWLARGKRERQGPFVALLADIKKGDAEAVARKVGLVEQAAAGGYLISEKVVTRTVDGATTTTTTRKYSQGQWQAAMTLLERLYPDDFGSDRRLIRDLKKMLGDLLDRVAAAEKQAVPTGDTA